MFEILLIASTLTLMFLFRDNNRYETVYSGSESNLSEANEYYWLLKNNNIPVKFEIPYDWRNFYEFGYKKSPVYIKVRTNDVKEARKVMMYYRVEKAKMEENMEADRNKYAH